MCDFLSQVNPADPAGQAGPEDQGDQQQSDQGPQGDQEDPEVPVVRVDPEVREDQEVQAVQRRNQENPGNQAKLLLNPQDHLVVRRGPVGPGVQEALEAQEVPADPEGQGDLMAQQLLPQGNQGDPVDPEVLEDLEVPVVPAVQKHLHPVNRVAQEDRVDLAGPEVLADPADLEGRDVLCVRVCQEQQQHRKVVRQNLELSHQQLENRASRFHQVIYAEINLFIFFSVRERAEFNKSCNLIGSGSGRNFSIRPAHSGRNRSVDLFS